jgi:hypothetical protein
MPKWAQSTLQETSDLVGDPLDSRTRSQHDEPSHVLSSFEQVMHKKDYNFSPAPFLYGIRIEDGGDTPLVENTLYRQLVGSILYLTHTHMDISVGEVSRYMQEPHDLHRKVAKRILKYVQGTMSYGIHYATGCALN